MLKVSGIHNYSSLHFSFRQLKLLSYGLNFIPTPSVSNNAITKYKQNLRTSFYQYRSMLEKYFSHLDNESRDREGTIAATDSVFVKKLHVKSNRLADNEMYNNNYLFKQYIDNTYSLLESSLKSSECASKLHRSHGTIRSNITKTDWNFIRDLIENRSITIKNTDKNLGIAIVNTQWYEQELSHMLSDSNTYQLVQQLQYQSSTSALPLQSQITTISKPIQTKIMETMSRYGCYIDTLPEASQIKKYVKKKCVLKKIKLPAIYLLIKVHKTVLCGRPIVPSHSWITSSVSVVVDYLLQPYIQKLQSVSWLVKDSTNFINIIETTIIPDYQKDGVFVAADIQSLYTNIDTNTGIQCVCIFLQECAAPSVFVEFIVEMLQIVMNNNILTFKNKVYRQHNGTAMGTSCAPCYANIITYIRERQVVEHYRSINVLYCYYRYLDDIFIFLRRSMVTRFMQRLNSVHHKLVFEYTTDENSIVFLDLTISKQQRFQQQSIFDLTIYQKEMNLYLYIPYNSFHTMSMKKSFIGTELQRYIRNTSSEHEYIKIRSLFHQRLLDRGYPRRTLDSIFSSFHYSDRIKYLRRSQQFNSDNVSNNIISVASSHIPNTSGTFRMGGDIDGRLNGFNYCTTEKMVKKCLFILDMDPLNSVVNVRRCLLRYYEILLEVNNNSYRIPKPTLCWRSMKSMRYLLIQKKQKKYINIRQITSTLTQQVIHQYLRIQTNNISS